MPPLPLPIEKENHGKSKQSLKPWSSFRELMSRPKVSQGDDRKRKISAPAKRNNVEEEILNKEEVGREILYADDFVSLELFE